MQKFSFLASVQTPFEHPMHMFKLMDKKIITIFCSNIEPDYKEFL